MPDRRPPFARWMVPFALAAVSCGGSGEDAPPPPARVLATDVVGPGGGTVAVTDGASLEIPPGALDAPTVISITELAAASPTGPARYGFEPDGQVFARPVVVRLPVAEGTTSAFVYWAQPGGLYEPVGGTVDGTLVRAQVSHFSGGYAGDETPERTVSGSRVITRVASNRIYNVPRDLSTQAVRAYVPRPLGGYDVYQGRGRSDGTFRVPDVPVGPCLLQVGNRYVLTSEDVVDLGEVMPGRRGLETVDISQSIPTTLDLQNLASWQAPAATLDGIGDRIDLFSGDSNTWFWNVQSRLAPALATNATALSGSVDLLHTGTKMVPVYAVRAEQGDHLVVAQQHATQSPTGVPYQAMTRVFEPAPVTVAPGVALSLSGTFADVAFASSVSVSWNFGAYHAAVAADANPAAAYLHDQFTNRFRVVGQAGGLAYGTHLLIGKPDFVTLPLDPATVTTLTTGPMPYGTPLSGDWGVHWIASADLHVPVYVGSTTGGFAVSTRSMGAIADTVSLDGPQLGLPRSPRMNGADAFTRQDGVGLTPTLSWDAPVPGPADGYTVQIVRLDGVGNPPWTYVAAIDTAETSLELPPGILESGKDYLAIIRAFRRGVRVAAPLRIDLPLDEGIQVTATFTP